MATPAAAQAETAATPAPDALPESTGSAAARFVEKQEAKAKAAPAAKAEAAKPEGKQKPRIDPNLIKREREATEALQRASGIEGKFKPLQEALAKRDIRGALELLAKDHGVSFADFVGVLQSSGDESESVEKKAERVARETIDRLKAADDAKRAADDAQKAENEKAALATRLAAFRQKLQTQAEDDSARWPTVSVSGTGGKAWEAIEAFNEAGVRFEGADAAGIVLDVVEEAHDLVKSHFAKSKQRLDIDKAIQLVVGELAKLGADGARAKLKESRNPGATGNTRIEAGEQRNSGRAAEPRISNATTSGGTGLVPRRNDGPVVWGKSAVDDALSRLPGLAARVA